MAMTKSAKQEYDLGECEKLNKIFHTKTGFEDRIPYQRLFLA